MEKYSYVTCQSCGDILPGVESYDDRDITTKYCNCCLDENHELRSFKHILDTLAWRYVKEKGSSYKEAVERARIIMKDLPAWKDLPDENWIELDPESEVVTS